MNVPKPSGRNSYKRPTVAGSDFKLAETMSELTGCIISHISYYNAPPLQVILEISDPHFTLELDQTLQNIKRLYPQLWVNHE